MILIGVRRGKILTSRCTEQITATDGPNGNIDWMNCGLYDGGWNPPHVTVNDVITVDLGAALGDSNTPFKACGPYIDLFYKYAGEHGSKCTAASGNSHV